GFAGVGGSIYRTYVNALNGTTPYKFENIVTATSTYKNRHDIRKALRDAMDKSYETKAQNQGDTRPKLFGQTFKPSGTIGIGVAVKLTKRLNLAIEDRQTFIKDDLLDGQQWQEHARGDAVLTGDFDSYNF